MKQKVSLCQGCEMESIIIKGGNSLKGTVNISGSKNASLPILVLSILTRKVTANEYP